jgi:hypothetical protein
MPGKKEVIGSSVPKAGSSRFPIGAAKPLDDSKLGKAVAGGSKKTDKNQSKGSKDKEPLREQKQPLPVGGRRSLRSRSRTRSYSSSYYTDSEDDDSKARGSCSASTRTKAAPIGARPPANKAAGSQRQQGE